MYALQKEKIIGPRVTFLAPNHLITPKPNSYKNITDYGAKTEMHASQDLVKNTDAGTSKYNLLKRNIACP